MKILRFVLFLLFVQQGFAQNDCTFKHDLIFIAQENKEMQADYLEVDLKNKARLQLFKTNSNRYFLKLIVTQNLFLEKKCMLELKSGSKSFFQKDAICYQYERFSGYYLVEILKNYVLTLKNEGLTGVVFCNLETKFGKQDSNKIKMISKCFYESIADNN
jgi:hypothetical protein